MLNVTKQEQREVFPNNVIKDLNKLTVKLNEETIFTIKLILTGRVLSCNFHLHFLIFYLFIFYQL